MLLAETDRWDHRMPGASLSLPEREEVSLALTAEPRGVLGVDRPADRRRFAFHRGVMVANRSQLGLPALRS